LKGQWDFRLQDILFTDWLRGNEQDLDRLLTYLVTYLLIYLLHAAESFCGS